MHLSVVATIAALAGTALGGINCEGDKMCHDPFASEYTTFHAHAHHAQSLYDLMLSIPPQVHINNNVLIACTRGICAQLKDTAAGLYAGTVVDMALEIVDHGCRRCGSVPYGYPENNKSNRKGNLVFDISPHPCTSHGLCPGFSQLVAQYYKDNSPTEAWQEGNADVYPSVYPPAEGENTPDSPHFKEWGFNDLVHDASPVAAGVLGGAYIAPI